MSVANGLNPTFSGGVTVGSVSITSGAGAPTHSTTKGSLYIRTDGTTGITRLYIATDAVGTWTTIAAAA